MDENGKIGILLADDQKIMREGLKSLFGGHTSMKVVGEAETSETISTMVEKVNPDIINLGINIPGTNSIDIVRKLVGKFPNIKIIAHSMYLEKLFVSEMLKAGICAYVYKGHDFSELLKAVDAVVNNKVYLCPDVAKIVMDGYLKNLSHNNGPSQVSLTDRERDILKLLSNGRSSKQIALDLHISTKTVDTHRRQIMNKLNLFSLPELTKYAIRCGLTSLN